MKEANGDTPRINITPSTGRPLTPQKRDRPSSSIGRPSSRNGETSEQWEDRILGTVFRFTLDPDHRLDSHENPLHYLKSTRQELEETSQPQRLNTSLLDQTILEAASNLRQGTAPLDYLLGCWKRINRQFKTLKRAGEQDPKFVVIKEARRLCMSYCIFAATMPDMFG
jgi:ubiquitin conjugation factor E4 B